MSESEGANRVCESCGKIFVVSGAELKEERILSLGRHFPVNCPEGLYQMCPSCDPGITECKSCRPKQDGQRS